jgi:diphosphomevalonate decarboxylase
MSELSIPKNLVNLQNKIFQLRKDEIFVLQNGDEGYASAPSNIALLKYWGKQEGKKQIPVNSSLSYTLGSLRSFTKVTVQGRFFPIEERDSLRAYNHKLILKDENNKILENKISTKMEKFLDQILFPYAPEIALSIESSNNFPTACGIASSASGYAALVGSIANLLQLEKHFTPSELQYWLCEWSRLGSGSATRSAIINKNSLFVAWDLPHQQAEETSTYDVPYHTNFNHLEHCVVVINENPKDISSSEGHKQAHTSPLHSIRVSGLKQKFSKLKLALLEGDFQTIKHITEEDAFAMHAVMQTGKEPACYLTHEVADIISQFIEYRDETSAKILWTLDAGPNIHFIYCNDHKHYFLNFIDQIQKNRKINLIQNKQTPYGLILGRA